MCIRDSLRVFQHLMNNLLPGPYVFVICLFHPYSPFPEMSSASALTFSGIVAQLVQNRTALCVSSIPVSYTHLPAGAGWIIFQLVGLSSSLFAPLLYINLQLFLIHQLCRRRISMGWMRNSSGLPELLHGMPLFIQSLRPVALPSPPPGTC